MDQLSYAPNVWQMGKNVLWGEMALPNIDIGFTERDQVKDIGLTEHSTKSVDDWEFSRKEKKSY